MCVCDCNLTVHKAVQLINDFAINHNWGVAKFYLEMNKEWSYSKLVKHLQTSFKSRETFSSLLSEFYGQYQKPKETEDQFANELQILARKVTSVCLEWRSQVNEALKTPFCPQAVGPIFCSHGPYFIVSGTAGHDLYIVLGRLYSHILDQV